MKALDLFCGAGGATRGLQLAGFEVTGVDIKPQPNYVGEHFIQANAMSHEIRELIRNGEWDLVWASPPCQPFTAYKRKTVNGKPWVKDAKNYIPMTQGVLRKLDCPWIIENVMSAPLKNPVVLCGSSFGLDIRRHRKFETSTPVEAPACDHSWQTPRFPPASNRTNPRCTVEIGVWRIPLEIQQKAMGIDWMTRKEMSLAMPPAYSQYLAEALRGET